eukprot:GSChrysophyteH1.ASY1.ANO1.705.1 assembled CDS
MTDSVSSSASSSLAASSLAAVESACAVYCNGTLLRMVQMKRIFNDSKTFVDMPMKRDPADILSSFDDILAQTSSDFKQWTPSDFSIIPKFLINLRKHENTPLAPQRHSLLPMLYPTIVPGGRFRESYYWDSYFIMRGLLVCDMHQTALNLVRNLLHNVALLGFVPNGQRVYYLDRSQPPLLSAMVTADIDGDGLSLGEFLKYAYPLLQTEYEWWMDEDNGHLVSVSTYQLNRYFSNSTIPRPESYWEDETSADPLDSCQIGPVRPGCKEFFFRSIRAGAESGWDFSSRWGAREAVTSIATIDIIPVDLNSILYEVEANLASLAERLAMDLDKQKYIQLAERRKEAIYAVFWTGSGEKADSQPYRWLDYNITSGQLSIAIEAVSSFAPLWTGLVSNETLHEYDFYTSDVLQSFQQSSLVKQGGIATTSMDTGQQWDFPNAWPPLVFIVTESMNRLASPSLPPTKSIATNISLTWMETNYQAFEKTGYMFEKYDSRELGKGGGGGEYVPQVGFGWTNAVALLMLQQNFGEDEPAAPVVTDDSRDTDNSFQWIVIIAVVIVAGIFWIFLISNEKHAKYEKVETNHHKSKIYSIRERLLGNHES